MSRTRASLSWGPPLKPRQAAAKRSSAIPAAWPAALTAPPIASLKRAWLSAVRFERIPSATERELVRFCFQKEAETAKRVSTVRISVAIPVVVEHGTGEPHRGGTINLCADGTKLAAPSELAEGQEVVVRFDERWFGRELALPATVGSVDKRGADLAFGEVSRADRAAINRIVIAEERRQRRTAAA